MLDTVTPLSLRQGLYEWFAVALAELRSMRRLARTWVFLGLGITVVGTTYTYYSYLHATSSASGLGGTLLPRFTTAYFNSYVLWFFMAALVFLAFDLRSRDERDHVAAVLDARPLSNLMLVGGRLCAVVLAIALPLFAVLVLIQAAGNFGRAVGKWVDPIEPVATFTFYFLDTIPALTLWCALVLVLAAGLRYRLVTAVAALALIGVHMWSFALVPAYLLPAVSLLYIHDNWASDLAPRLPDAQIFLHRASMFMLAAALVLLAAVLHQRPDGGSRSRRLALAAILAVLSVTGIGTVVLQCIEGVNLRESWLAAHKAAAGEPQPLVEHVAAEIGIDPGTQLRLDVEMEIKAAAADLPSLLFSFNPGLVVAELLLDDEPTPFRHERGLLIVEPPQPIPMDRGAVLTLRASGIPDPDFAYLDSAVDWRRESSRNGILWLGTAAGIFEKSYVALMPELRWLPVPGPNLDDAARGHSPTVDLAVRLPKAWLVAGPGRRQDLGDGRFRFRPGARVPKVGLFAAPFERRAIQVAGVELELLLHPSHLRNLDFYASAGEHIRSRLEEIFRGAAELGIPYPYGGFAVVEVPAHLREYGGGVWLDTKMVLPGVLLLKEHGFPYANVWLFDDPDRYPMPNRDAWKAQWLEMSFAFPFRSGSALRGLARNLVTFQTTAVGTGAHALDYVGEELARELFSSPSMAQYAGPTMFTAHSSNGDAGFGATLVQMIDGLASQEAGWTGFSQFGFTQQSVWERAIGASLAEMDFEHDPSKAIGAFALRGNAVARSIADGLGRNRTAALLSELRRRSRDGAYEAGDFAHAGAAIGADIEQLIGDWLNDVALPGFVVSRAFVERVADDADGKPRYEIRVHVHNDEPTPGLVRVSLGIMPQSARSEPVRVEGKTTVEVGMVAAEPPQVLWLEPYLALNRAPFRIDIEVKDEGAAREPFVGTRSSNWAPPPPRGVVIDDLDPGFFT
ncbi:MAG: M1 family metallopeptidase, partial [Gammaproteobacteria bacterium]|nr:M1 family metallopeptidase [Gammaproteobacteria bacterium]